MSTGHGERVQRVRVVAVLLRVRLRVQCAAGPLGRHPPLRPWRVSGCPLLYVRLSRLRHLPPGYRVPGPRYGNLSNALPLMLAASK